MKPRGWQLWGKRGFIGFSFLAIVMTAASDDGIDTAQMQRVKLEQPSGAVFARPRSATQAVPEESRVEIERLDQIALQPEGEEKIGNAFGSTSWYVPPPSPPPVKPAPPPKPTAPPLPFSYLGRYEDSALVIMLVKGDRLYTVTEGDVIENTYRVERVTAGMVELTYLPLNIRQSISTGAAS